MPQADGHRTNNPAYPRLLESLEAQEVETRRVAAGVEKNEPLAALALSGGGIRSATFSLGVLQALAKSGLLKRFDFLSTVSGGGYIGGFLGSLYSRAKNSSASGDKSQPENVEAALRESRSGPLGWLRENGRYLSPNGSGDNLMALAVVLRNGVALHVVMATLGLASMLALIAVRWALSAAFSSVPLFACGMPGDVLWWSPYVALAGLIFGIWALPVGWAYWLTPSRGRRGAPGPTNYQIAPWVTVLVLVLLGGGLIWYYLAGQLDGLTKPFAWFAAGIAVAAALALLVLVSCRLLFKGDDKGINNELSNQLRGALLVTFAVLLLGVVDSLGQTCYAAVRTEFLDGKWRGTIGGWATTAAGALGAVSVVVQRILLILGDKAGEKRAPPPLKLISLIAALVLVGIELTAIACLAHGAAWGWKIPDCFHAADSHWYLNPAQSESVFGPLHPTWLLSSLLVLAFLSYSFGRTYQFLNRSSHAPLYSARITRAYLGASNAERMKPENSAVTQRTPTDDLQLADYRPHALGGPLHIINTTLNETIDGRSQIEQQDRKGMGLAVGPVGVSVGVRHHAFWGNPASAKAGEKPPSPGWILRTAESMSSPRTGAAPEPNLSEFRVFQSDQPGGWIHCEQLSLGQWVGISGAAFSTGIGARTSLGMSLLCGLFNVRLGHWWYSGVDPKDRKTETTKRFLSSIEGWIARRLSVQWHLLDESLARFPGTARRNWYLSDGGHFENTACYELIRRRVPFIVLCDNGEDPEYLFEDIASLVRKARLDFGAEISFLGSAELDAVLQPEVRPHFGELEHLRRGKWAQDPIAHPRGANGAGPTTRWRVTPDRGEHSLAHAALARIQYAGDSGACSYLVVIKPTLTGSESKDLLEYHGQHGAFPQEPTVDQFFDEAQWESYRKLGEHIGGLLFQRGAGRDGGWSPGALDRNGLELLESRLGRKS